MTAHSPHPFDPSPRDPLAAYIQGDPRAVKAVAPPEPGPTAWEATRLAIQAELFATPKATHREPLRGHDHRRWTIALVTVLTVAAAGLAGVLLYNHFAQPVAPEVQLAERSPAPREIPSAPASTQPEEHPETTVLPIATDDDVVLHRVPGDGWLPVGRDLLPVVIVLATPEEVKIDETLSGAWPHVVPGPDAAPMIFAAKPR